MKRFLLVILVNPAPVFCALAGVLLLAALLFRRFGFVLPAGAAAVVAIAALGVGPAWSLELPGFAVLALGFAYLGGRWRARREARRS